MSNTGQKKAGKIVLNNVGLKILSVILAVVLWLLVINIDDPQVTATIRNVPVKIMNENAITDNNEVYDVLSGGTVDIKITGPRTIVDTLGRDDFTATADFKDLSKTNAVPIDIALNNTRYETKITITEKSENAMRLSVRELVEQEYELSVKTNNSVQPGYVIYNTTPEISAVSIKAPQDVHKKIARVAVVLNFTGKETGDFEYRGDVLIYDADNKVIDRESNHITLSDTNIMVAGTVYYKKTVNISYTLVDNLSGRNVLMNYDGNLDSIDIVGRKTVLDGIDEITIPKELTTITDDKTQLVIDLKTLLPDDVFVYGSEGILEINAELEGKITKTISVDLRDIWIKKVPTGYEGYVEESGTINIVISGLEDELEDINAETLAPYVDMSNAVEGKNTVKVDVMLPEGVDLVSEVRISVLVAPKNSPNDETTSDTSEENTSSENTTEETESDTTIDQEESTTP